MLDIIGETLVFGILYFVGGCIRWLFATLFNFIFNTPKQPFKAYVFNSDNKYIDDKGTGCVNIIIGIVFVALAAMLIYSIMNT